MKEVKLDERTEKTTNYFFEEESPIETSAPLNFSNGAKMFELKDETVSPDKYKSYFDFFKQALLFFPGTFILFYVSLATAGVLTDLLKNSDRHFIFEPQLIFVYLLGFLSVFFTWFGVGDLKNKKHFVIPGSIILSGAIIGAAVSLTDDIFWLSRKIIVDFGYAIYLFPVGLIIPFLAKAWVDRKV